MGLNALTKAKWMEVERIKEAVLNDLELLKVIQNLSMTDGSSKHYSLVNECLLFKGRLVIPRSSAWVPKLLIEFHATPVGEHAGALRTYKRLASFFFGRE